MFLTIGKLLPLIIILASALAVNDFGEESTSLLKSDAVRILRAEDLRRAEKVLQNSLRILEKGEGPHYRIFKVHSATQEVPVPVSGTLTELRAELIDNKNVKRYCNVAIWSRPWRLNNIQITFECEGEYKMMRELIL